MPSSGGHAKYQPLNRTDQPDTPSPAAPHEHGTRSDEPDREGATARGNEPSIESPAVQQAQCESPGSCAKSSADEPSAVDESLNDE
eukprot:COSAG02_NODE_32524_length_515_cov_0.617788_1_plen_85_part_10